MELDHERWGTIMRWYICIAHFLDSEAQVLKFEDAVLGVFSSVWIIWPFPLNSEAWKPCKVIEVHLTSLMYPSESRSGFVPKNF